MAFLPNPRLHEDERVQRLRPDTLACYLLTGHWSSERGYHGFVPQAWTCMRCVGPDRTRSHALELVDAGLWIERWEEDPGYRYLVSYGGDSPARFERGPRQPIDPSVRDYVMWRDAYRCRKCQRTDHLCIDHTWPWVLGGSQRTWNLRVLCRDCNVAKGVSLPEPGEEHHCGVIDTPARDLVIAAPSVDSEAMA